MRRIIVHLLALCCASLYSGDQAIPWTPAYLTVRSGFAFDQMSANVHTSPRYQGRFSISAAPVVDWWVGAAAMASSCTTPKISLRAEKQLLCDLTGDFFSATGFIAGSVTTLERAKKPVYFEMASKTIEGGLGIGRHIANTQKSYTQLFSYLTAGVGSHFSRYASVEIGLNHVYAKKHTFLATLECLKTFPTFHHRFEGIATQQSSALSLGGWYQYRFDSGVEVSLGGIKRFVHSKRLSSATVLQLQITLPIAL